MADGNFLIPTQRRDALVRADTIDEKARTVEVLWTTGARVRRRRFFSDDIDEELVVTPQAIRAGRLNAGAPFLNAHDAYSLASIIGVVVENSVRIENGAGYATVRLSDREDVEPIWRDIASGIIRNVSVGYRVHKYEIEKRDGEVELWRAVDWEPLEISAVPIGADPGAHVRSDSAESFPCVLARRDANAGGAALWKGIRMADGQHPAQTPEDIRTAERRRVAMIDDLARRHHLGDAWRSRMIESTHGLDAMREIALEQIARRDNLDIGQHQVTDPDGARRHVEPLEQAFTSIIRGQSIPTAIANEVGGRRFSDLCRYHLRTAFGMSTGHLNEGRVISSALSTRSGGIGYAAQGTGDLATLLENVMNKELLARDKREASGIRRVAYKGRANDFRPQNRYRGGAFPQLQNYSEHGEIRRGALPDGVRESLKVQSKGQIVSITRQALVNDDLGAFAELTNLAAESIEATISAELAELVQSPPVLSDGIAVFHASRGNVGSGGALSETTLGAGKLLMRKMSDLNGERAGIAPKYLLVPAELEITAQKLLSQVQATKTSDVNPFAGELELVVESRLTDPARWYLIADPAAVRGLEYAFLDGAEGGQIEVRTGWEVDGIEIRSILDLGVAFIDPRGWVISG